MENNENGEITLYLNRFTNQTVVVNTEPLAELFRFTESKDGVELASHLLKVKEVLVMTYGTKQYVDFETVQENIVMLEAIARIISRFYLK